MFGKLKEEARAYDPMAQGFAEVQARFNTDGSGWPAAMSSIEAAKATGFFFSYVPAAMKERSFWSGHGKYFFVLISEYRKEELQILRQRGARIIIVTG